MYQNYSNCRMFWPCRPSFVCSWQRPMELKCPAIILQAMYLLNDNKFAFIATQKFLLLWLKEVLVLRKIRFLWTEGAWKRYCKRALRQVDHTGRNCLAGEDESIESRRRWHLSSNPRQTNVPELCQHHSKARKSKYNLLGHQTVRHPCQEDH